MDRFQFDYSKLRGRIAEKCGSQKAFAERLNITEATMTSKMSGTTYFSQNEIMKAIDILGIEKGNVSNYFFTPKVEKTQLPE